MKHTREAIVLSNLLENLVLKHITGCAKLDLSCTPSSLRSGLHSSVKDHWNSSGTKNVIDSAPITFTLSGSYKWTVCKRTAPIIDGERKVRSDSRRIFLSEPSSVGKPVELGVRSCREANSTLAGERPENDERWSHPEVMMQQRDCARGLALSDIGAMNILSREDTLPHGGVDIPVV